MKRTKERTHNSDINGQAETDRRKVKSMVSRTRKTNEWPRVLAVQARGPGLRFLAPT